MAISKKQTPTLLEVVPLTKLATPKFSSVNTLKPKRMSNYSKILESLVSSMFKLSATSITVESTGLFFNNVTISAT